MCLQEVATVLIRLYQQYTFELLHPQQQVPLPLKHTFALIPAQGLRVRVHSRTQKQWQQPEAVAVGKKSSSNGPSSSRKQ